LRVLDRTPSNMAAIAIPATIDTTGYPGMFGMPDVTTNVTVVVVVKKAVFVLVANVVISSVAVAVCVVETEVVDVPTVLVK